MNPVRPAENAHLDPVFVPIDPRSVCSDVYFDCHPCKFEQWFTHKDGKERAAKLRLSEPVKYLSRHLFDEPCLCLSGDGGR